MAAVWAADSYSRGGLSLCLAGSARLVTVPGGSTFHLELITIVIPYLSVESVGRSTRSRLYARM